jgi:formylglycine-generating enzyme required for sulfatase activity
MIPGSGSLGGGATVIGFVRIGLILTASVLCLGAAKHAVKVELGEKPGDEMVLIPGGCFLFGPSEKTCSHQNEERAVERLCLQSYWIDKSEVTTEQYQKCVSEGICARAGEPELPQQEMEMGNGYPVVRVGWKDASKYCKWANKRLPTDWEWERASGGRTCPATPVVMGLPTQQGLRSTNATI